jgi:hypothetical protein
VTHMNKQIAPSEQRRPSFSRRVGAVLAVVLTPIVWPLGVVLLWLSPAWTRREKLIGTLVLPGGLLLAWVLWTGVRSVCQNAGSVLAGGGSGCAPTVVYSLLHPTPSSAFNHVFGSVTVLLAIALPLLSAIYLLVRLALNWRSQLS